MHETKYVYLDSSTFSRIVEGKVDLLDKIRRKKNLRLITSLSHVVEALPKDRSAVDKAVDRLRLIMDETLVAPARSFFEVTAIEKKYKKDTNIANIICSRHEMLPTSGQIDSRKVITKQCIETIDGILEDCKDQNLRRQQRARFIKRGKLQLRNIEPLARAQEQRIVRELELKLPELTPLFQEGGLYDFLFGKTSAKDFDAVRKRTLLHPVVLAKALLFDDPSISEQVAMISRFFWSQCEGLQLAFEKQIDRMIALQEYGISSYSQLEQSWNNEMQSGKIVQKVADAFSSTPAFNSSDRLYGTENFVNTICGLFLNKMRAHGKSNNAGPCISQVKLRRSDYGDCTHTFYQPYVDMFVCDRKTASILKKACARPKNICGSDAEIDQLLKTL